MTTTSKLSGPIHQGPCYGAPCVVCDKPVRGIVYFAEQVRWQVGTHAGVSFFYAHTPCLRPNVKP